MSEKWTDRILIQNLKLDMSIGIYEDERRKTQPVTVTAILEVLSNEGRPLNDIQEVASYETIVREIQRLAASRHYALAERLAEDIANTCLAHTRITSADISVIKTAIMPETAGVGIQIRREKRTQ